MTDDPIEAAEALIAAGRAGEAVGDLRARLAAGRGGLLARLTLVRALTASRRVQEALAEAREAVALNPNVAPAVLALGEALLAADLLPTAIAEFQLALRLDRTSEAARFNLARAWLRAGEGQRALEALTGLEPSDDVRKLAGMANAMLAAKRCDAGYVRHLFDQFAGDYDQRMIGQLGYAAPRILVDLALMVMPALTIPDGPGLAVLDLGCGTGLAGLAFRPFAARLDGVDLSPLMVEKARARGIYDHLAVADLEAALAAPGPACDLIVAADTFVYLGDLAAVFAAAARRLAPDGLLLFTTEAKAGEGFDLGPKRRWRHSEAYLRACAEHAGLDIAGLVAATARHEAGTPVEGFAVALGR